MDCGSELRAADEHPLRRRQIDKGNVSWGERIAVWLLRTDSPGAAPQQAGCLRGPTFDDVEDVVRHRVTIDGGWPWRSQLAGDDVPSHPALHRAGVPLDRLP